MKLFQFATLAFMVITASSVLIADEKQAAGKDQKEKQSIRIQIKESSEQQDDQLPATRVRGRIIIAGPDGVQEFDLGEKMPEGFPLKIRALSGENGEVLLHAEGSNNDADSEPRYMVGIRCSKLLPSLADEYNVEPGSPVIDAVIDGLPAAEAGLEPGDVLIQVGKKEIESLRTLVDYITASMGEEVEVTILRDGEQKSFKLKPKMVDTEELKVASDGGGSDDISKHIQELLAGKGARNWVLGPGLKLEDGAEINIQELIKGAQARARIAHVEATKATENKSAEQTESAKALQKQIRRMQKQIEQLKARIRTLEETNDSE